MNQLYYLAWSDEAYLKIVNRNIILPYHDAAVEPHPEIYIDASAIRVVVADYALRSSILWAISSFGVGTVVVLFNLHIFYSILWRYVIGKGEVP